MLRCTFFLIFLLLGSLATAQDSRKGLPRENVIDIPAIGKGLCVSNTFQSNMVIQRDKPISIWGWAAPGEKITVEFGGNAGQTETNDDRTWKVTLPACAVNRTAQILKVSGAKETLKLDNILVGDVWVLGGQSNMEFPLSRIENGQLEIVSANYPQIRILTVPAQNGPKPKPGFARLHEWSGWFSRHFRKGDWDVCTPAVAKELSAIGFVFGRRIHMATQVPIGIIDASRGGTTVETWTPDSVLRTIKTEQVESLLAEWDEKVSSWDSKMDLETRVNQYQQRVAKLEKDGKPIPPNLKKPTDLRPGPPMDQNRPGNCFASMISPLAGLQIKGAIFHQGYNNCFNGTEGAMMYRQVFPEMIKAWRAAFNDPELPFGILSLCTEGTAQSLDNYSELMFNVGPFIREAQYQTFLSLYKQGDKNIGFVSTYDLRRRWYHPQLKIPAGERAARWALATQYGFERDIRWKPPIVESVEREESRVVVRFDEPVGSVDDGSSIAGFAIAGDDGKFHPAQAEHLVTGKDNRGRPKKDTRSIVLTSPLVKQPKHYRYAWARSPLANLQAARQSDIPIATQRSDHWSLAEAPSGVFEEEISGKLDRGQKRKVQQALKALDAERKFFKAKELLKSPIQ